MNILAVEGVNARFDCCLCKCYGVRFKEPDEINQ